MRARFLFHEHFDRDQVYLGLRVGNRAWRIPLPCAGLWYWLVDTWRAVLGL